MTKKPQIAIAAWFGLAGLFAALAWQPATENTRETTAPSENALYGPMIPVSISRFDQRSDHGKFVGPIRPAMPTRNEVSETRTSPIGSSADKHWAFQPLHRPHLPPSRASHPIDAYLCFPGQAASHRRAGDVSPLILTSDNNATLLESSNAQTQTLRHKPRTDSTYQGTDVPCSPDQTSLTLAPSADARTLMRRLYFDVLGLPPTYEDVQALANDDVSWLDVVDDVLARPQFGERWARHWLDVARYADSNGYEYDEVRWNAYPYRDWVIRAINDDLPFDDFVRWQIAGDELLADDQSEESVDAMTATGFLTAGPHNTFFPQEIERYDELDDIVHTIGQAFLGLSIGCARCHDHKTEPISQVEYYRLVAAFQSTSRADRYLAPDAGASYIAATTDLRAAEARSQELIEIAARDIKIDELDDDQFSEEDKALLKAIIDPDNERQTELIRDAGTRLRVYEADTQDIEPRDEHLKEYSELVVLIDELSLEAPEPPDTTLAIQGSDSAPCWVLEGGDVEWKGDEVTPGFLSCIGHASQKPNAWRAWDRNATSPSNAKPRSALAFWLTDVSDGAGALVARVAVNRVWQHYFGRGLVETPNNFGTSGESTEHKELLDELAAELVDHNWSMKHIHRLIVTSHAYRQAIDLGDAASRDRLLTHRATAVTAVRTTSANNGPIDKLAQRALHLESRAFASVYPLTPRRLDAEAVRDAVYAVSGQLNLDMYGPAIQPPIPNAAVFKAGEQDGDTWPRDAVDGPENWRRSLYIQHRRSNPVPLLALLGEPEAGVSCASRATSVVPTQTLALWNEPWLYRQASDLAAELEQDAECPVEVAYQRILQRDPTTAERAQAESLVAATSLTTLTHALMLSNEFLYVD